MLTAATFALMRGMKSWAWAGPTATYLAVVAILVSGSEPFADGAIALGVVTVPLAAWQGIAALASDDPVHQSVVATLAGGRIRARLGQLLTAMGVATMLTLIALAAVTLAAREYRYPAWSTVPLASRFGVALVCLLTLQALGLLIAYCAAWPVFQRGSVSGIAAAAAALVLVPLPGLPVRLMLVVLAHLDRSVHWTILLLGLVEVAVLLAAVGMVATVVVGRLWRLSRD